MLGYHEGDKTQCAVPIVGEYDTLKCSLCAVPQTHHSTDGIVWRCVICDTTRADNGGVS